MLVGTNVIFGGVMLLAAGVYQLTSIKHGCLRHCRSPLAFLSTGHGTLGWTMAAGSGRLIADFITGRAPDIDPEGFGIERYRPSARPKWQPRVAV